MSRGGGLGAYTVGFIALWAGQLCGRDKLREELLDPKVRAFLDVIAYAEGTFFTKEGYRRIFGKQVFKNFRAHPRQVVCASSRGRPLCSSAAGRYQFSQKMWKRVASLIGARDFSPANQDRAAVFLLHDARALEPLKRGKFDEALRRVRKIWASLPGAPYNQPMKKLYELRIFFKVRLWYYQKRRRLLRRLLRGAI
jgi:muramidase (phage lysozyme)